MPTTRYTTNNASWTSVGTGPLHAKPKGSVRVSFGTPSDVDFFVSNPYSPLDFGGTEEVFVKAQSPEDVDVLVYA